MDERTCTALRGSEQLHSVPSHLQLAANALGESLLPSSRPLPMSQALDQRPVGLGFVCLPGKKLARALRAVHVMPWSRERFLNSLLGQGVAFSER